MRTILFILSWVATFREIDCNVDISHISYRRQTTDAASIDQFSMGIDKITRSYIECVAMCTGTSGCSLTSYNPSTQICKLATYSSTLPVSPTGPEDVRYRPDLIAPIDGQWLDWGLWSTCSVSCGIGAAGSIIRYRTCGSPTWGGDPNCSGTNSEIVICTPGDCAALGDYGASGHWGNWGAYEECPALEPITRYRVKEGDSTLGLTGFHAQCKGGLARWGHDYENSRGSWGGWTACPSGYMAVELRIEKKMGIFNPDPAMYCVKLQCRSDEVWYSHGDCSTTKGTVYGPISCPSGRVFCAIRQRVDHYAVDNSGLNGLRFKCCPAIY